MLSTKLRELFTLLKMKKDMKIQARSKKLIKKKRVHLPDIVWFVNDNIHLEKLRNIIFDYSSPFDVVRWSRVNRQLRRVAAERAKATIYLDVLRIHLNDILPIGVMTDGDFFRHPTSQLMAHSERRSVLLAAHSQWTVKDATKLVGAIQYYGKHAHTLDASIAELIVASQCTADLTHWFAFQATNCGSDSSFAIKNTYMTAHWVQQEHFNLFTQKLENADCKNKWNPKTQRIPLGPLFPKAKEVEGVWHPPFSGLNLLRSGSKLTD
uniref:F-box domain-containing protein n=1 Tax=Heterorhabditis bacteriophora TaxID=37862 RepID=A0A1I7XLG3_HETBA